MTIEKDRGRLSQATALDELRRDHEWTDLVTVYLSDYGGDHNYGICGALVPVAQIDRILSNPFWNVHHGVGIPGAVKHHDGEVEYLSYGVEDGVEPLVIARHFFEMRDDYTEISEEFRLFHRLYHDRKTDEYIKIDDDGNEDLVAVVEPNRVRIRLKEIRQFLAVKAMYLSIQFDRREHSKYSLEELGLTEGGDRKRDDLVCWALDHGRLGVGSDNSTLSRLVGKRLITPLPKSKSGFWGFAEELKEKHLEFIIGVDENGDEMSFTSNPDALANYFGANPEAPHYLTLVYFRKEVLDKYYQQPGKYSVGNSLLSCGSLWCMPLDNDHDTKVCAWLGDLGQNLPYAEQLHWRSCNIPPQGSVSKTYHQRQILNMATDSDRPEHLFKRRYHELQKACDECLGWPLLLPLDPEDKHHLQSMRVPATDEQGVFDNLVLGLTKILIDSLNEKQLKKLLSAEQASLEGGIARLEAVLLSRSFTGAADHVSFLRRLQDLRSSAAAHRKGRKYRKIAKDFGVEGQGLRIVFAEILHRAAVLLDFLIGVVRSNELRTS